MTTELFVEVEAESEDDAIWKAEENEIGNFRETDKWDGDFEVTHAEEIKWSVNIAIGRVSVGTKYLTMRIIRFVQNVTHDYKQGGRDETW